MMRALVFNQQDGVGKTMTAINLSAALAAEGHRAVVIDLDPKMGLSSRFSGLQNGPAITLGTWLAGAAVHGAALDGHPRLSLVAADAGFSDWDAEVALPPRVGADWCLFDAPSEWIGLVGSIALQVDLLICPVEPDANGMLIAEKLVERLDAAGFDLRRLRILISKYSNRMAAHRASRSEMIERFGSSCVLPVLIRSSARLAEADESGRTIFQHAPRSTGASDFTQLARSLMSEQALGRA